MKTFVFTAILALILTIPLSAAPNISSSPKVDPKLIEGLKNDGMQGYIIEDILRFNTLDKTKALETLGYIKKEIGVYLEQPSGVILKNDNAIVYEKEAPNDSKSHQLLRFLPDGRVVLETWVYDPNTAGEKMEGYEKEGIKGKIATDIINYQSISIERDGDIKSEIGSQRQYKVKDKTTYLEYRQ